MNAPTRSAPRTFRPFRAPKAQRKPRTSRIPSVLAIVSLVSALILLVGALQKTGRFGGGNFLWDAWVTAAPVTRFFVMLTLLAGLLGAGSAALTLTWKRKGQMDLLAASAFLVAGLALLVGATYQPQWGASQVTPIVMGGVLAAGFIGVLFSAGRRYAPKKKDAAEPQTQ